MVVKYLDYVIDVDFSHGMNISFLSWNGYVIIKTDDEKRKKGLTYGMPIMFPTPNRTNNNTFNYNGNTYKAKIHGLVRNLPFSVIENKLCDGFYKIVGELDWNLKFDDFFMYPFEFKLKITIILNNKGINYSYDISNCGQSTMAYGFGVHPFFNNINGDATIQLDTNYVLEADNMINTGEVVESQVDLRSPRLVKDLKLDTVYYFGKNKKAGSKGIIKWTNYKLTIQCSKDFSYMVVYTPDDGKSFCIEPQTCSIDGMNLFNNDFKKISGIIEIKPSENKRGTIYMEIGEN